MLSFEFPSLISYSHRIGELLNNTSPLTISASSSSIAIRFLYPPLQSARLWLASIGFNSFTRGPIERKKQKENVKNLLFVSGALILYGGLVLQTRLKQGLIKT